MKLATRSTPTRDVHRARRKCTRMRACLANYQFEAWLPPRYTSRRLRRRKIGLPAASILYQLITRNTDSSHAMHSQCALRGAAAKPRLVYYQSRIDKGIQRRGTFSIRVFRSRDAPEKIAGEFIGQIYRIPFAKSREFQERFKSDTSRFLFSPSSDLSSPRARLRAVTLRKSPSTESSIV